MWIPDRSRSLRAPLSDGDSPPTAALAPAHAVPIPASRSRQQPTAQTLCPQVESDQIASKTRMKVTRTRPLRSEPCRAVPCSNPHHGSAGAASSSLRAGLPGVRGRRGGGGGRLLILKGAETVCASPQGRSAKARPREQRRVFFYQSRFIRWNYSYHLKHRQNKQVKGLSRSLDPLGPEGTMYL